MRSSIRVNRRGRKVLADIIVIHDPDRSLTLKFPRPTKPFVPESTVQDEQLPALLKRRAGLDECSRSLTSLDDDRRFGQRRHRDVPLREELSVQPVGLLLIALYRHLAD